MFQPEALGVAARSIAAANATPPRDRSRSRERLSPQPPWSSGDPDIDAEFYRFGLEEQLLEDFCFVPFAERKRVMQSMQRLLAKDSLTSPGGYVNGVIKKHFEANPDSRRHGPKQPPRYNRPVQSPSSASAGSAGRQNTETVDPSTRRSFQEPTVPPQAVELAALIKAPSEMTAQVITYLQPHQEEWFFELSPPQQLHVAWCLMLTGPSFARDQSEFFDHMIARCNMLFPQKTTLPRSLDTPSRPRVTVQVVLIGMSLPASLAISNALVAKLREPVNDVDIVLKPAVVFHDRNDSKITADDCVRAGPIAPVKVYSTVTLYAADVRQNINQIISDNLKFVVLCAVASVVTGGPLLLPRLIPADTHMSNCHFYDALQLVDLLRQQLGGDDMVTEAILSPPPSGDWLSEAWGNSVEVISPRDWLPIRPIPSVYGVPSNFRVAPTFTDSGGDATPINGQQRANVTAIPAAGHFGAIRGHGLAKTISEGQFQTMRQATAEEAASIEAMRTDNGSGYRFLPCREWWIRWMCMDPQWSAHIYNAAYPCMQEVRRIDGKPHRSAAPPGAVPLTKCGDFRYCASCELVLKHLDRGFCESTMADTALSMISNAAGCWARKPGQLPLQWGRPTSAMRQHQCKKNCDAA